MPISRRHAICGLVSLLAGAAHGQSAEPVRPPRALVFGLITPRAVQQTKDAWSPFIERLGKSLGMPIDIKTFPEQAELVNAFRKGEIDLSWMGNGPALEIAESGAGSVFAQMVTKDGKFGFNSVLIVPRESKLRDLSDALKDARGLRFADGDLKSASGHLVPAYFAFQKNGIDDVERLFKTVRHGSHQTNLMSVAKGEVDIATANNEELAFFARDYPALAQQVRVIWESPLIPQSPLLWKNALPVETRRHILKFTNNFGRNSEEEMRILEKLNNLSGFRQSSNRQLVTIADLEMFKARQAINHETRLSADERAQRIEQTIKRGSKLDLLLKQSSVSLF